MIREEIEDEKLQEHPEAQPGDPVLEVTKEELEAREKKILPHQIADIVSFARNYNAPDEVEAVFEWDINDIFYNYFFVGKYLNACGKDGDRTKKLDLYNDQVISCRNCPSFLPLTLLWSIMKRYRRIFFQGKLYLPLRLRIC